MKIKAKLLVMQMLSLFMLGMILLVVSIIIMSDELEIRIEESLKTAVAGYCGDVNYLRNQGMDIDITVFTGDTRTESSIAGAVGTKAADKVIDQVLNNKKTIYETNVSVNGEAYYGYYIPTDDGMLFAGKPRTDVQKFLRTIILVLCGIALAAYVICLVITMAISNSIAKRIQNAATRIKVLADGDLSGEVEETSSKSKDEVEIMNQAVNQLHIELKGIVSAI